MSAVSPVGAATTFAFGCFDEQPGAISMPPTASTAAMTAGVRRLIQDGLSRAERDRRPADLARDVACIAPAVRIRCMMAPEEKFPCDQGCGPHAENDEEWSALFWRHVPG